MWWEDSCYVKPNFRCNNAMQLLQDGEFGAIGPQLGLVHIEQGCVDHAGLFNPAVCRRQPLPPPVQNAALGWMWTCIAPVNW